MFKKITIIFVCLCSFTQASDIRADVKAVSINGSEGAYTFSVKLHSIETGCNQYADWWEVISNEGVLLYRRILAHSHPDTQPFTRSGGQIDIKKYDTLYVRAHMNKLGYIGDVMKGSVETGFKVVTDLPTFSWEIENQSPLPKGCLY